MGRNRKNEDERLDYKLPGIRVTLGELEKVEAAAREHNLSKTDMLRRIIFKKLPKFNKREDAIVPKGLVPELSKLNGSLRNLYNDNKRNGLFDANKSAEILDLIKDAVIKVTRCCDDYWERRLSDDWQSDTEEEEPAVLNQ